MEQHSVPAAQALPRVVQVPAVVETTAQLPPVQVPEQHCEGEEHAAPTVSHAAEAHVPDVHAREQHSLEDVQVWPASLQNAEDVHCPDAQTVEQQSEPAVQASPPTPQGGAVGAAHFRSVPHVPEQHCPGLAAEQVAPAARHCPAGSTQIPFAQEFVQQFASEPQARPTALHVEGVTQVPVHAPLQHSDGCEQVVPSALQVGRGPHVPPLLHWAEQHSPAAAQRAPSALQICAAPQKPLGHAPEQHSAAATHAAPSALHAVAECDPWGQPVPARTTAHSTSAVESSRFGNSMAGRVCASGTHHAIGHSTAVGRLGSRCERVSHRGRPPLPRSWAARIRT